MLKNNKTTLNDNGNVEIKLKDSGNSTGTLGEGGGIYHVVPQRIGMGSTCVKQI